MAEENVRIRELNDLNLNERPDRSEENKFFVEVDGDENNESNIISEESKKYDLVKMFNAFTASTSKFGSVKIGTETTIRNPDGIDNNENILPASVLPKLFNNKWNVNDNDIVGNNNNNNVEINNWDTVVVGKMIWHRGVFNVNITSSLAIVFFKNIGAPIKDSFLNCYVLSGYNTYKVIPTIMDSFTYEGENITRFRIFGADEFVSGIVTMYIDGWYVRE